MRNSLKTIGLSIILAGAAPAISHAQGIPVFDASSFAQLVQQVSDDATQLTDLQQQLTNQLDMLQSLPSTIVPGLGNLIGQTQNLMGQIQSIQDIGSSLQSDISNMYPTSFGGDSVSAVLSKLSQMTSNTQSAYENSMQLQDEINTQQPQLETAVQQAEAAGMAAPGDTSAIQSGDQMLGAMSTQLAGMQDTMTAAYRAQEQQQLQEASDAAANAQLEQQTWSDQESGSQAASANPFP
ncbi:MAG: type IV secretion system protein [Acidiphilium sp.]|nr:type IV secretion system protein [Acidiphilium sp.]